MAVAVSPGNDQVEACLPDHEFSDPHEWIAHTSMCNSTTIAVTPQSPTCPSLSAVPNMVRNSKRVQQYFGSDQLANFAGSFKSRKKSKTGCCQSSLINGTVSRPGKRKASTSLSSQKAPRKQSTYEWRGVKSLPRVNANLATKFPSLFTGRPPDIERT